MQILNVTVWSFLALSIIFSCDCLRKDPDAESNSSRAARLRAPWVYEKESLRTRWCRILSGTWRVLSRQISMRLGIVRLSKVFAGLNFIEPPSQQASPSPPSSPKREERKRNRRNLKEINDRLMSYFVTVPRERQLLLDLFDYNELNRARARSPTESNNFLDKFYVTEEDYQSNDPLPRDRTPEEKLRHTCENKCSHIYGYLYKSIPSDPTDPDGKNAQYTQRAIVPITVGEIQTTSEGYFPFMRRRVKKPPSADSLCHCKTTPEFCDALKEHGIDCTEFETLKNTSSVEAMKYLNAKKDELNKKEGRVVIDVFNHKTLILCVNMEMMKKFDDPVYHGASDQVIKNEMRGTLIDSPADSDYWMDNEF
nr:PREDICTED: uncharacterized protein LOC109030522 [Bemisia tabaci]